MYLQSLFLSQPSWCSQPGRGKRRWCRPPRIWGPSRSLNRNSPSCSQWRRSSCRKISFPRWKTERAHVRSTYVSVPGAAVTVMWLPGITTLSDLIFRDVTICPWYDFYWLTFYWQRRGKSAVYFQWWISEHYNMWYKVPSMSISYSPTVCILFFHFSFLIFWQRETKNHSKGQGGNFYFWDGKLFFCSLTILLYYLAIILCVLSQYIHSLLGIPLILGNHF